MSDPNLSAPPGNPHWLLEEPDLLPLVGQASRSSEAAEGAPAPVRARAAAAMPPFAPGGYEQIVAARAATLRAEAAHAVGGGWRMAAGPPTGAVPIEPGTEERPRRGWAARLPPLVLASLVAPPALVLVALVLVEPLRSPLAPIGRAESIGQFPAASLPGLVAPARPAAGTASSVAEPEPPQGGARSRPAPHEAEEEPTSLPAEAEAAPTDAAPETRRPDTESGSGAARDGEPFAATADAETPATGPSADHEPARAPAAEVAADPAPLAPKPRPAPAGAGGARPEREPATAPTTLAADPEPEPTPASAAADTVPAEREPSSGAVSAFAPPAENPPEEAPPAAAAPADPDGAAPPRPNAAPAAGAVAGAAPSESGAPAPAPPRQAVAVRPPAPEDRAPAKNRLGGTQQPRAARATGGDAPSPAPSSDSRCRAIVLKAQLGEETSNADRSLLQSRCGARR